jgi:drug/metabolite transporter (DMT)-like permease
MVKTQAPAARLAVLFGLMVTAWSLSFIVVKVAAREIPAVLLTAMRAAGSAIIMIAVAAWDGRQNPRPKWNWADAPKLLAAATTGITLNQLFYIVGVSRTSVAHSSIVIALLPAIVHLMAVIAGQERVTLTKIAGMATALGGVAVLQLTRSADTTATLSGDLIVFLGTLVFSFYTVLSKELTSRYGGIYQTALGFVVGAVTLPWIAWWSGERVHLAQVSPIAWLSLSYMILIQSVVAYLIYYYLLAHVPASRVSMFTYFQPVLATLFAWMLLNEPVTGSLVAGGAIVIAGVWLAERKGTAGRRV